MFSVVIPLYNKEHTIINTLNCVLKQTYKNYEIVIVNDGSTDSSLKTVKDYAIDNPLIRIIEQDNQGVSVARNTGVVNAKYKYVAFLDGDDEWFPEYLEKMKNAIDLFPNSEMYCSGGMGKNSKGEYKPRQIDKYKGQVLEFNFFENPHVFLHVGATVITKKIFKEAKGFPIGMKRNEDYAFLYSAALFTKPIYSGYPLSVYVGGVAGQATNTTIYEDKKLLEDVVGRYNLVYDNWIKSGADNTSFIVFMKYELRHQLMVNSLEKEFDTNLYFLENLNPKIVDRLSVLERMLIKNKGLLKAHIFITKLTKLKWRMNGFERLNF